MRVLFVDDHLDTLFAMSRLLQLNGHQTTTATTLAEARRLCETLTFDLLITDIRLPDGDGRLLAEVARKCGAKAISVSGLAVEVDGIGFQAHLTKPIDFGTLQATVDRVMRVRR